MVHSVAYLGFHEGGPKFLLASAYAYAKGAKPFFPMAKNVFFCQGAMAQCPLLNMPLGTFGFQSSYVLDPHHKAVLLYNTDITTDPKMFVTRFPLCSTMKDIELDRC